MKNDLPFRQVHLDFHTSEHIPGVGSAFEPEQFAETLAAGYVNSITLFARGHHGWVYYPSERFAPHPNLQRPDMLGEMIRACHKRGIATPVYITVQWDNKTAREHPEWRLVEPGNSDFSPLKATWFTLCLNYKEYQDLVLANALEVIERYPEVEGLFFDIVLGGSCNQCLCPKCLADMQKKGYDCENPAERNKHYFEVGLGFMQRCSDILWQKNPELRIIYNSGHLERGREELLPPYSHLELESLPTGGWGYDHFPISAAYAATKGKKFLGMSGKFHTTWGEFGGFKRPEALEYESAQIVAMGGGCSIGDQLHPCGKLEDSTYKLIGSAYRQIAAIEPYLEGARPVAKFAILSQEAMNRYWDKKNDTETTVPPLIDGVGHDAGDRGAARMLLQEHHTFAVVDATADFSEYELLILPDTIALDETLAQKIQSYMAQGGRLIASGFSGMDFQKQKFLLNLGLQATGKQAQFAPNYMQLHPEMQGWDSDLWPDPFVMYSAPALVEPQDGTQQTIKAVSRIINPYFQRSWQKFCSHQHTPYRYDSTPEPGESLEETGHNAAFAGPDWVYFAHPIFSEFYKLGQPLLKFLFRGALKHLAPQPMIRSNLPAAARVFVNEQREQNRILVHLLYASIRKQGNIEIIEDRIRLTDTHLEVLLPQRQVERIFIAPKNEELAKQELDYTREGDYIEIVIAEFTIHALLVIELA